jgi:hypothetical protein
LHYISERGVAEDINEYKVIGSGQVFSRPFLAQLWHNKMRMKEFGDIAYFIIKYVERYHLDEKVGVGKEKPQIWMIPNSGFFSLHGDDNLPELETETQERLENHADFMTKFFRLPPVADKLGYLRSGASRITFKFETFVEKVGQTGTKVRKIRILNPDKMLEKCRVLFEGIPLVWDAVN